MAQANATSGLAFSVYVGELSGGRSQAVRMLNSLAMTSAFSQGDLVGGLVRGIQLLGSHGRHDRVLHTDEPA